MNCGKAVKITIATLRKVVWVFAYIIAVIASAVWMVTSGLIIFAAVIAVIITSGVVYAKHQDTRHGCSRPAIAELFKSEKVPIDELSKVEQKMEDIGFVLDTKTTDRSEIGRALRGYGVDPTQGNLASASSWRCPTAFPILLGTRYSLIIESADGSLDLKMK